MANTPERPSANKGKKPAAKKPATKRTSGQKAGTKPTKTTAKKPTSKKKKGYGRIVIMTLLIIFIVLTSLLIFKIGKAVFDAFLGGDDDDGNTVQVNPIPYETTPVELNTKVGYYLFGVMGEDGLEGEMDLLSLVCFDKEAKTVNVLQMPKATYLGDDDAFKVKRLSEVYASPQDQVWCDKCGCRVYEPAVGEDNTHKDCGTPLGTREGSSTGNLAEVFNRQYGLPIDGFYIFEQTTLRDLVNYIDGITVELAFAVATEEVTYAAGMRTINGEAALKYIAATDKTVGGDMARFDRFNQVCTAVLQRLFALDDTKLTETMKQLQVWDAPIRVEFGITYAEIAELVRSLRAVTLEKMQVYVLPGEKTTKDGEDYYSVHRAEVLTLLNDAFNPHRDAVTESDINLTEIANTTPANLTPTPLSKWKVEQSAVATQTTQNQE